MDRPKCGKCKTFLEFPKTAVEATESNFGKEVLEWPGAVLVVFWSPVCSVCVSILPMLQELARRNAGVLKVVLINADKDFFFSSRLNIQSVPTFFLYRNGVKINELKGALPQPQFEAWIDSSLW